MMMVRRKPIRIKQDVLGALISYGALSPTNISCFAKINSNKLKKILVNLKDNGLIINKNLNKNESLYLITSRGLTCYRKFSEVGLI